MTGAEDQGQVAPDVVHPAASAGDETGGAVEQFAAPPGWVPQHERMKPPFAPGHTLSVRHGGYSPRKFEPLAGELVEQMLADESVPAYVKAPAYRLELWALARATAQTQLVTEWLLEQGEAAGNGVGDLGSEAVRSAWIYLHRAEQRAASSRSRLGLTPVSAARLGRDVAQGQVAQVDVARRMAELHELEKAGWTPPPGWGDGQGGTSERVPPPSPRPPGDEGDRSEADDVHEETGADDG